MRNSIVSARVNKNSKGLMWVVTLDNVNSLYVPYSNTF